MANMSPEQRRKLLEAEVRELNRAIKQRGLWVPGSRGQEILNPALAARRAALEAIRKLDVTSPAAPAKDPLEAYLDSA
jgi:hypothetical protein